MARRPKDIMSDIQSLLGSSAMNGEAYKAGLPLLFELREKVENLSSLVKSFKVYDKLLADKLSDYCEGHKSALDDTIVQEKDGQWAGTITLDGKTYRFCKSKYGYLRNDGSNLTQSFLETLPSTWTRTKLELNATAINAQNPSDEELANEGLERGEKREWSILEKGAA